MWDFGRTQITLLLLHASSVGVKMGDWIDGKHTPFVLVRNEYSVVEFNHENSLRPLK